jgi:hypothetical protein
MEPSYIRITEGNRKRLRLLGVSRKLFGSQTGSHGISKIGRSRPTASLGVGGTWSKTRTRTRSRAEAEKDDQPPAPGEQRSTTLSKRAAKYRDDLLDGPASGINRNMLAVPRAVVP